MSRVSHQVSEALFRSGTVSLLYVTAADKGIQQPTLVVLCSSDGEYRVRSEESMTSSFPHPPQDLTELLSEVYDADRLAKNPRTRDFLEAGARLLREDLTRDAGTPADGTRRPPFEEVLAWLSRRRVVTEALRAWKPDTSKARDSGPTEAAYRYRWRTQAGYLRDLVIWALSPRMQDPNQIKYADQIIDQVQSGERQLPDAIGAITSKEVKDLKEDPAFRLQMVFQATLAHDPHVADALYRIDKANVDAWTEFARRSYAKLGLTLRNDINPALLGCALHAAGEGVMFRAMLPPRPHHTTPSPAELLHLIAKALVIATADPGDGKTLDEILNEFVERHRHQPDGETYPESLAVTQAPCDTDGRRQPRSGRAHPPRGETGQSAGCLRSTRSPCH
jgi:hypothetical protein